MLSLPDGKQHSALGGAPSSNHLSALGAIAQHHKSWHQWQLLLCHTAPCHRCPRLLPLCPWSTCVSAEMQGSLSCSIPSPGAAMVQERALPGMAPCCHLLRNTQPASPPQTLFNYPIPEGTSLPLAAVASPPACAHL